MLYYHKMKIMRFAFCLFVAGLSLIGCNNPATTTMENAKAKPDSPAVKSTPSEDAVLNQQVDSTITFSFAPGSDSLVAKGHMEKKGDPVICYLQVDKGKKLRGKVIPDKAGANIRFSHIYMPDGSSDGPFGQSIEYALKQKGLYRLYISPNRMAGDPESTDFTVTIIVR